MTVPRELLDGLTSQLNALSGASRRVVRAQLEAIEWSTVAELREKIIAILEPVLGSGAEIAAAYAATFYDDIRELSVGQRLGAAVLSGHSAEATEGAVRAMVQAIADGGSFDELSRLVLDRVDYEYKRAAGECVKENGRRDPKRPRFARVPTGAETCPFCIMLASRGFVYLNRNTAGDAGHYHPNCDCRIVPGFDGETDVQGYDPDKLYQQYLDSGFRPNSAGKQGGSRGGRGGKRKARPDRAGTAFPGGIQQMNGYLRGATSLEELYERADEVMTDFKRYWPDGSMGSLQSTAKEMRRKLS